FRGFLVAGFAGTARESTPGITTQPIPDVPGGFRRGRLNYSLTPSPARPGPLPEQSQQRILLVGDAGARPDGLERFLVRGGFQVTEAAHPPPPPGPPRPGHEPPAIRGRSIGPQGSRLVDPVPAPPTPPRF